MDPLAVRSRQPEQMDREDIDAESYTRVLTDLARVNRWTFTASPTLHFLARAAAGQRHFRLLDVGFGHGDMLRAISRWARRRGIAATLIGIDLNPRSAAIAGAATPPELGIDFRTGDYRDVAEPLDYVVSSQVAHHMSDAELATFIAFMEARAARGWLISDLRRHRFAHRGFPLLARVLGVHRIVREDGTLSIARSFRAAEWPPILTAAGIPADAHRIVPRFPFRLAVERIRAGAGSCSAAE